MFDVVAYRFATAVLLAAVAYAGVTLPSSVSATTRAFALANAFGGGVILSASLVHMLPEASECEVLGDFPWGPAMLATGYLFLLSIELIADRLTNVFALDQSISCREPGHGLGAPLDTSKAPATSDSSSPTDDPSRGLLPGSKTPQRSSEAVVSCASHSTLAHCEQRPLAAVAATFGLTAHALLEGLALGLRSSWTSFALVGFSIAAHKLFAALALGAIFAGMPQSRLRQIATLVFCSATPAGILIGSALLVGTSCVVSAPLGAFAAGSLMWVALHEVISPAMHSGREASIFLVLSATWAGFGAMTVLALWV